KASAASRLAPRRPPSVADPNRLRALHQGRGPVMATTTDDNPPAQDEPAAAPKDKDAPAAGGPSAKSAPATGGSTPRAKASSGAKDAKGLSSFNELNLERTVIRRGLATAQEVEYCKAQRAKLAAGKPEPPGLLEVMIAAKALTASQARRLTQELGDSQKKF